MVSGGGVGWGKLNEWWPKGTNFLLKEGKKKKKTKTSKKLTHGGTQVIMWQEAFKLGL